MRKLVLPLLWLVLPASAFGQSGGEAAGALFGGLFGIVVFVVALIVTIMWIAFPVIVNNHFKRIHKDTEAGVKAAEARAKQEAVDLAQRHSQLIAALEKVARAASSNSGVAYYLARNGATDGPHAESVVRSMYDAGMITDSTPAMRQGDQSWSTVGGLLVG